MKVTLIKPPVSAEALFGKIKDVGNYQQPLGLAYLAGYLRSKGHELTMIDALVLTLDVDQIIRRLEKIKPDVIGISCNTIDFTSTEKLATEIKSRLGIPIILGGPHITAIPDDAMKYECFDVGIVGEAEISCEELLKNFKDNKFTNLKKIPGAAYRKNGKVIVNPKAYITDLDSLPFPARDLLPKISLYKPTPASAREEPLGSIITSRGCPFQCTYCDKSVFGSQVRMRSPENIIEEIIELKEKYKVKEFKIWDDIFNIDNKRTIEFCKLMIKHKINLPWTCIGRVNFINEEQTKWLKKAGCWQMSLGIESGNNEILRSVKKAMTTEMITEKVNILTKGGISVRGFFMIGMPGDTDETIMDTINFAKSLPLDAVSFAITTPYPNTELYENYGTKIESWDQVRVNDPENIIFCPKGLTKKKLKYYYNLAYKSFYLRPSYIFRKIKDLRNFYTLKGYWVGLKSLMRL